MYKNLALFNGVILAVMVFLNGMLSNITGPYVSTLIYHITGLILIIINYLSAAISSILICFIMIKYTQAYEAIKDIPLAYLSGGFIGVLTTYIFNLIISEIPAVYVVILRFSGQMLASTVIDYVYLNIFSKGKLVGGLLFLAGLIINARIDKKYEQKEINIGRNSNEIRDYNVRCR